VATPTTNTLGVSNVAPFGAGSGLMIGSKWGGAAGTGATITYSFPNLGVWSSGNTYGVLNDVDEWTNMSALTVTEQAWVKAALAAWSKSANLTFIQSVDNASTVGEIRFAQSALVGVGSAAHAYYPSDNPSAGDVWFSPVNWNADGGGTPRGSYDFLTILHELGHSLGLKHPFTGPNRLDDPFDNFFYTIMSYTASRFSPDKDNYASFYPTTPMYYDLLAIQALYGTKNVSTGNSTYTFNDGTRYFQCINDSAGYDQIVFNGTERCVINLNPKAFSQVSETIFFNGGSSRATVSIGPDVVIERATGGTGNDALVGNSATNTLIGRAGNDTLRGNAGNDTLVGGPGDDTLYGGPGSDSFLFNSTLNALTNIDRIIDYDVADDVIKLENSIFTKLGIPKVLPATWFKKAAVSGDANDYILYHPATGNLIYDPNGSGAGLAVTFAVLPKNLAITNTEFMII
jgi:Ca2+-binding RTX toxin-like protein